MYGHFPTRPGRIEEDEEGSISREQLEIGQGPIRQATRTVAPKQVLVEASKSKGYIVDPDPRLAAARFPRRPVSHISLVTATFP